MKMKSFKNSLRFTDPEKGWWRIKYPGKMLEGRIEHYCINNELYNISPIFWHNCSRSRKKIGIFCDNCSETVPDEVVAAGKLLLKSIRIKPEIKKYYSTVTITGLDTKITKTKEGYKYKYSVNCSIK